MFTPRLRSAMSLLLMLCLLAAASTRPASTHAQTAVQGPLNQAFADAAAQFDVPRDLLVTIGYAETRLNDHDGQPSVANGYGIMHLVDNNQAQTLGLAAQLLNVSPEVLKTDSVQNIRGGAAVLRRYADEQGVNDAARKNSAEWYSVVARYSNATSDVVAQFYADEAYKLLNSGFSGTADGETITVLPQNITPNKPQSQIAPASPDFAAITSAFAEPQSASTAAAVMWAPAAPNNYTVANRPNDNPIKYIVIHTTQGSYTSALNWFQNPAAGVSAHYTIRSSDGQITQSVSEKNIAYHAGNWTYNAQSVGIEHEGYVTDGTWYTDAMYRSSAALTRSIALRYNIPMDRTRIIGHNEVPGATHTDPGRYWNWTYYMQLVKGTWSTTIDNTTAGRFGGSSAWSPATYNTARYGADYRYTTPKLVSDAAWFKASLPATANYEVYVWYPANSAYNSSTPFVIKTTSGNKVVNINQQTRGGQWVSLGTFNLAGGDYQVVGVSRYTSTPGYIIADAVKIVRR